MALEISSSPHIHSPRNTAYLMRQVLIALIPAILAAFYLFGLRALLLIGLCTASAVLSEWLIIRIRKKPATLSDGSAVVSGVLLALILPPSTAWYAAVLGSAFAIIIGKHVFGGLGKNIFNPALIGRAFLMAAYPQMLNTYIAVRSVDAVTSATPLTLLKFSHEPSSLSALFWGTTSGSLGETSAFCLLLGGGYLLIRKIADWRIPISLLLTTTIISIIGFQFDPLKGTPLFHFLSGGLLLGAFFMATDPVTTPTTKKGRYIFGIGCGVLIMTLRYFSGFPEGVMYSILFMNALTPLINRYTKPLSFGKKTGPSNPKGDQLP